MGARDERSIRQSSPDPVEFPLVVRERSSMSAPTTPRSALSRPSVPVRMCVGCRERVAKSELVRFVAGSDACGDLAVVSDPDRSAPGRGGHLHPTVACYELAVRRRALVRALRVTSAAGRVSTEPLREYVVSLGIEDPRT